ncbi:PHB depolymerase family esterase [Leptospira sp. WS92.C1]
MKRIASYDSMTFIVTIFLLSSNCGWILRNNLKSFKEAQLETLDVNEKTRTYLLHVPKAQENHSAKLPLVLVLHGRLGNGEIMMNDSGFNEIADREGFIVVYPNGIQKSWADGRGATPADLEQIDDVQFLEKLIQHLLNLFPIAADRVFIVGHSNGGFMTQRMLVEKSKLFKAGASVSSQLSEFVLRKDQPTEKVSVAFLAGTEDPTVPYYGGYVRDGGEILSVEDSVNRWLQWNSCSKASQTKTRDDKDDATKLEIVSYDTCKEKTSVRLYKIVGGGHNWPGRDRKIPFSSLGNPTSELNAAEEIWQFFKTKLQP